MSKRSGAMACSVCAVVVSMGLAAAPASGSNPSLQLLWSDPAGILRDKLLPRGYETMAREVTAIFEAAEVTVEWSPLTEEGVAVEQSTVLVVLTPKNPTGWGLPAGTLGAVMGEGGPLLAVYVFQPSVSRELGIGRPKSSRDFHELGRAVGRVAAHEIVHALAPGRPRTEDGLMQESLSRTSLLYGELRLSTPGALAVASSPRLVSGRR